MEEKCTRSENREEKKCEPCYLKPVQILVVTRVGGRWGFRFRRRLASLGSEHMPRSLDISRVDLLGSTRLAGRAANWCDARGFCERGLRSQRSASPRRWADLGGYLWVTFARRHHLESAWCRRLLQRMGPLLLFALLESILRGWARSERAVAAAGSAGGRREERKKI